MPLPHLLVVDDQRLDRAIASHAATRAGFKVTGAATLGETRDLFEAGSRFNFILLDLSLGTEDGLELLPLIARFNPAAIIVLASGFDGRVLAASQRVASGLGLLVAGVLRKPILPTALQRMLRQEPHAAMRRSEAGLKITPDEVRLAIADGQINPWFQPKISLATGNVTGAEALARWVRADGRSVEPTAFVAVAERSGLIAALTDSVLDQALRACALWRVRRPDCWVAVNISPLLLDDRGLD